MIIYDQNFYFTAGTAIWLLSLKTCFLHFLLFEILFLLMMDIAKPETFRNFTILNKDLLFFIELKQMFEVVVKLKEKAAKHFVLILFYTGYLTKAFYTEEQKCPYPTSKPKHRENIKFGTLVGVHQNFLEKLVLI